MQFNSAMIRRIAVVGITAPLVAVPSVTAWAHSSAQSSSTVRTQDTTVEQDINVEPGNDRPGNDGLLDGLLDGNDNNRPGNDGLLDGLLDGDDNKRDSSGFLGLF